MEILRFLNLKVSGFVNKINAPGTIKIFILVMRHDYKQFEEKKLRSTGLIFLLCSHKISSSNWLRRYCKSAYEIFDIEKSETKLHFSFRFNHETRIRNTKDCVYKNIILHISVLF